MEKITLHIVDDDSDLLEYLSVAMASETQTIKTYESGQAFLDNADDVDSPGCVLLDVNMPQMSGLELQDRLIKQGFKLPIIFLTAHADVPMAVKAMQAGACDFIQKPVQPEELSKSIQMVLSENGQLVPVDEEIVRVKTAIDELTPREREVMYLIVKGDSNKEAAQKLDISPRTVEIYRATVMRKMDAPNLPDLVRKAIAVGL